MRSLLICKLMVVLLLGWSASAFAVEVSGSGLVPSYEQIGTSVYQSTWNATFSLSSGSKTADYQVKGSPGYVDHMVCIGTDATATAGTIILYDSLTETGTTIFTWNVLAVAYASPIVIPLQVKFATGLFLGYTTTADVACTVMYR